MDGNITRIGTLQGIAASILLSSWPLLNFLAHNKQEHLNLQSLGYALAASTGGALLVGMFLWLGSLRRIPLAAALPAGGVAAVVFFSYEVVEKLCAAVGLAADKALPAWLVAFAGLVSLSVWLFRRPAVVSAVALAALLVSGIPAAEYGYHVLMGRGRSEQLRANSPSVGPARNGTLAAGLPNVYYFILDMYARADNLRRYYRFDNTPFLRFLDERGFRVLTRSYSNYRATEESVTTTLYMDYVIPALRDGKAVRRSPAEATPILKEEPDLFDTPSRRGFGNLSKWLPYGSNRVEKAGGELKVTAVGGDDFFKGTYTYLGADEGLASNLTVGAQYRLRVAARANKGSEVRVAISGEGVDRDTSAVFGSGTDEVAVLDFVPKSADHHFLFFPGLRPGDVFRIRKVELRRLPESPLVQTLGQTSFDFELPEAIFDTYLGSSQHLSPVLRTFREIGYHVLFANLAGTRTDACEPYCLEGHSLLGIQDVKLIGMTPVWSILRWGRPDLFSKLTTAYQKNPADVVRKIPADVPAPFFLFAHVLSPHPPFVFNPDCSVRNVFDLEFDPAKALASNPREMHRLYLEQLNCVNSQMREAIDLILARDPGAIIVIQGDHGLGKLDTLELEGLTGAARYTEDDFQSARYGILSAFRVPRKCEAYLYDSMTSVNTFRFVFGCLSEAAPNFVPDRMFASPEGRAAPEIETPDR